MLREVWEMLDTSHPGSLVTSSQFVQDDVNMQRNNSQELELSSCSYLWKQI